MHRKYIAPTREEKARNDLVMKHGCVLSRIRGERNQAFPRGKNELHHLVKAGKREGQRYTVCLNAWYHRGVVPYPFDSKADARAIYGASIADGSKTFVASHGLTEWDLWRLTQAHLGLDATFPATKIVPRRSA